MNLSPLTRKIIILTGAVAVIFMIGGGAIYVFALSLSFLPFSLGVLLTSALNAIKTVMIERTVNRITEMAPEKPAAPPPWETSAISYNGEAPAAPAAESAPQAPAAATPATAGAETAPSAYDDSVMPPYRAAPVTPEEETAVKNHARLMYLLRFFLTGVVLAAAVLVPVFDIWGAVAGLFTLPIAASLSKAVKFKGDVE